MAVILVQNKIDKHILPRYLKHYEKWLPPQHFHMSEIKILLVQLLAKDQQELMVVSDEKLQLKLKFAQELVELYEKIAPCNYCDNANYCVYAVLSQVFACPFHR